MRFLLHLLSRHLRQYPGRSLTALAVLMLASTLMLTLAGAGAALQFRVGNYLGRIFPEEQLWLEAGRAALGPIALEPKPITDATVKSIRERPEVAAVWPVEPLRIPAAVSGNLFGQQLTSDAVVHGVERELVADALSKDAIWGPPAKAGEAYPVVVSRFFIDLYNLGMARAAGLPLLSESSVVGRHATFYIGASTVMALPGGNQRQPRTFTGVVVGLTSHPGMLALMMPADVVRALNKEYLPNMAPQYVKVAVRLKKGADRDQFLQGIAPLGLVIPGSDLLWPQLKRSVRVAGWTLMALAAGVLTLGMLTFYTLFTMIFHARRLDLVRLRALGLSPTEAVALALGEVGAIAFSAIALATLTVGLLGGWLAGRLQAMASVSNVVPPELFQASWGWLALAGLAILALTITPALPVLRWIVKVEPAQVIRDL